MQSPLPSRLAGLAAAFAGFLAQGILPAAHAWRVGPVETAYHAAAPAAAATATLFPERRNRHSHHSEDDCALYPLLARAGAPPNAVHPTGAFGPGTALRARGLVPAAGPARPDAPPRGPPAAA